MRLLNRKPPGPPGDAAVAGGRRAAQFRLVRYFSATSLVAFLVVAAVLYGLEQREIRYFSHVEDERHKFVLQLQQEFSQQLHATARDDLLRVHEAGHVTLTRVIANALWDSQIGQFMVKAQRVPVEHCRAPGVGTDAKAASPSPTAARTCYAEVGKAIKAIPGFPALDATVASMLKSSTVFKVKVYDLRGITVYSSEHQQIGEDKRGNEGWRKAAIGQAASELTHRDSFGAFEGVVENRDLIQSYVPVYAAGGRSIVGVFEIYSDVTPFLEKIKSGAEKAVEMSNANAMRLQRAAAERRQTVVTNAVIVIAGVAAILSALYFVLLLIVRHGQRIIEAQAREQEQSFQREEGWHREKMAALAAMAAKVSHEIGNPLATIAALAEQAVDRTRDGTACERQATAILAQTQRISDLTRRMSDFVAARNEERQPVDINQLVRAVCDFMGFDQRFGSTVIEFKSGANLPAVSVIPDHVTETLMGMLLCCLGDGADGARAPARITVEVSACDAEVVVRIAADVREEEPSLPADLLAHCAMQTALRRAQSMGTQVTAVAGSALELRLPCTTMH